MAMSGKRLQPADITTSSAYSDAKATQVLANLV